MVQIVGISALDDHDHKIKEDLDVDEFGRYMDDSLAFHPSREYLEYCRKVIGEILTEKG